MPILCWFMFNLVPRRSLWIQWSWKGRVVCCFTSNPRLTKGRQKDSTKKVHRTALLWNFICRSALNSLAPFPLSLALLKIWKLMKTQLFHDSKLYWMVFKVTFPSQETIYRFSNAWTRPCCVFKLSKLQKNYILMYFIFVQAHEKLQEEKNSTAEQLQAEIEVCQEAE